MRAHKLDIKCPVRHVNHTRAQDSGLVSLVKSAIASAKACIRSFMRSVTRWWPWRWSKWSTVAMFTS